MIITLIFCCGMRIVANECRFGECEYWSIVIIPLLTDRFRLDQVAILQNIMQIVTEDCQWYLDGYINLEFLTKYLDFIQVRDPTNLAPISSHLSEFKYSKGEQESGYIETVGAAIDHMKPSHEQIPGHGRFIFVVTNFERIKSGSDSTFLETLNDVLVSSNIMRVALVETQDVLSAIRPCPIMTTMDKIKQYHDVKKYYYERWFDEHYRESLIGFFLLCSAVGCALVAYVFGLCERAKRRKLDEKEEQAGPMDIAP
ncbi:hypothetical protein DdX_07224 [Ditylenchus destructor]|uniref:Uncharacterized protein n=1 Tax=Ditylenchus destructor TaxID=166010 RepID=A0AAD4R4U8_9BILA|nr:hypothetical protein DdX_07224 [Ditylenchus destructor]